MSIQIRQNIDLFKSRIINDGRECSFDFCFNYFQNFRSEGRAAELANPDNLEISCLQLGFYLASWGMYRGSTHIFKTSSHFLTSFIVEIARADERLWSIDVNEYNDDNIDLILQFRSRINDIYQSRLDDIYGVKTNATLSQTLFTKMMLGVFGSVPAFDSVFTAGCKAAGICATFNKTALKDIYNFYNNNVGEFYSISTIPFNAEDRSQVHPYSKAKLIDMALFIEGESRQRT